ncbi:helix-turn-helix domain containing protein [Myxococcus sp. MISCRS1]|uniref:TetR/AcrR family transcriptional regulator n=1 Tax=Myxococcus sp. MISCRS1 TaxID=2996786 RepID=UPI00226DE54A|nr:TetR/AcrR family transcriptional regulator [Myxococcus sp. MISCRS1]MCY0997529.1 helix-turn-helix domain containing protein [Myxococcus sp. MISCRS1]
MNLFNMSLRERAKSEKWERIRAAAKRLFAERGYEGTTVRAIAEAAGVATGTVLVYGETKDALLHELWRAEAMPLVERAVTSLPGEGLFVDRCMHLFSPLLTHYASQPELARVVVKELPWLTGAAEELHRPALARLVGALASVVSDAKSRGELRAEVDCERAAELVFGVYFAAVMRMLVPMAGSTVATARARLRCDLEMLFVGLGSRRSS